MSGHFGKTIVIALGGSIVVPGEINTRYLKQFTKFVNRWKRSRRFLIVVGGGEVARKYQKGAARVLQVTDEDKDWIGIHATRLNAHLLRTVFREVADPVVFDSRKKRRNLRYPVTIASGWHPGWSTDFVAVQLAADFGAGSVIIAGKPSHVYTSDPEKGNGARPIQQLSWREYRRMIPKRWVPGSHFPVDPIAARLAEKEGVSAVILDGRDLKNLDLLLNGRPFRGTIIL